MGEGKDIGPPKGSSTRLIEEKVKQVTREMEEPGKGREYDLEVLAACLDTLGGGNSDYVVVKRTGELQQDSFEWLYQDPSKTHYLSHDDSKHGDRDIMKALREAGYGVGDPVDIKIIIMRKK